MPACAAWFHCCNLLRAAFNRNSPCNAAFCPRHRKASACPRLIKASVDTGSLCEDAMIEGSGVCVCVCLCGVIHLYSRCLSSLCVTDKDDSTPSIWEDRIIIQTAPCHYWHTTFVFECMSDRKRVWRRKCECVCYMCVSNGNCLTGPGFR